MTLPRRRIRVLLLFVPTLTAVPAWPARAGGPIYVHEAQLTPSDGLPGDSFGWSVAISGDTAVVGAQLNDTPAGVNAGAAYVFVHSGTTWTEQQELLPSDGAADDRFGYSVSLDANTAAVGAPLVLSGRGAAYVFVRTGTAWTQQQKLLASDGAPNDFFGTSLSLSADTVVGGANADDTPAGADAGSAYAFV